MIKFLRFVLPEFQIIHMMIKSIFAVLKSKKNKTPTQKDQTEYKNNNSNIEKKDKELRSGKGRIIDA